MCVNYSKLTKCVGMIGLCILSCMVSFGQTKTPKNIIFVIGDGMSHPCIQAANYYTTGKNEVQAYEKFPVKTWQSSFNSKNPKGGNDVSHYCLEYRSDSAWIDFNWVARDARTGYIPRYTDSAPAATALSTGTKTADGILNIDIEGELLFTITEQALSLGKRAGVVTNVQLSHATPAGFIAHHMDRNAYDEISREMFASKLSVIVGTGHPDYNNDAQFQAGVNGYNYVGGQAVWNDLLIGGLTNLGSGSVTVADIDGDGIADPWHLIQDSIAFAQIANGATTPPKRLLGIPRAGATTQAYRDGRLDGSGEIPFSKPLNIGIPSLAEMSMAALNVLKNNNGFFVMIEGGAIDWANHDNNAGRMIEDMIDFNSAIDAIIAWVEANGGWEENLLIVTSDHECGYFLGPNHQNQTVNNPVDNPIVNNGAGNMPGYSYHSPNHTNMLVPVYAKGAGSEMLKTHESRTDFYRGKYIDNTDIARSLFTLWQPQEQTIKNFIFMISDGYGYNQHTATNLYQGKTQSYDDFPMVSAMSTYPGRTGNFTATNELSLYRTGYNSANAWSDFDYVNHDYTDSAPAASAMAAGEKIYDGALNVSIDGNNLLTLPQVATRKGKSAGVVTSVELSHATPAGLGGAHNPNRNAYGEIAQEMFFDTHLSVIIGSGHPHFDNAGAPLATPNYTWIGESVWHALTTNSIQNAGQALRDINGDGMPDAWTLIQDSIDFAKIAAGENVPLRLAGIPKVHETLQAYRNNPTIGASGNIYDVPKFDAFAVPFLKGLPNLSEMSLAALNVLNQNKNGFFVMIEGGAIDWANHANHLGIMIQEQIDFNNAVDAVIAWVEANSNWNETLLVITSDHECGYLTGPNHNNQTVNNPNLNPIVNNGTGILPGHTYHSGNHTNMLVPVFAKGAGAEKLDSYRNMYDYVYGYFMDNTDIPHFVLKDWNKLPNAAPNLNIKENNRGNNKEVNILNVYPTLVDNYVTIEAETGNMVEVFNISGQLVFSQKLTGNRINLGSLSKGLYIIRVLDKHAKIVKK